MEKKILVATDGSSAGSRTLEMAGFLAQTLGSDLVVVTVVPDPSSYLTKEAHLPFEEDLVKANEARAREVLERAKDLLDMGQRVKTRLLVGKSSDEIIQAAQEEGADLLVIGNRGSGAYSKTMLGSVANKLVNHWPGSVLVVKGD